MNDSTNSQSSATGGNTTTGNPQNIGSQTIITPPQNLQSSTNNLFSVNGTSILLTDPNGKPVNPSQTTIPAAQKTNNSSNHGLIIFGMGLMVILVIVAAAWIIPRQVKTD